MQRRLLIRGVLSASLLVVTPAFSAVEPHGSAAALDWIPELRPLDSLIRVRDAAHVFGRSGEVKLLFVDPGQRVEFPIEVEPDSIPLKYEWTSLAGTETAFSPQPLDSATVYVPVAPGFYYLTLLRGEERHVVTEPTLAVMRPFEEKSGPILNGYRIGTYLAEKLRGKRVKECPDGFLEVYPQHLDLSISKHFRVRDFITHDDQAHVWPKYVAVNPRLLDKLELVVAALESRRGGSATRRVRLTVHSGFRTPRYNRGIRLAARDSRHQYGDAADIGLDADGNGRIDRVDWRLIIAAVEAVEKRHPDLVGGLGIYSSRRHPTPYVHIDARGTRSRWKG